MNIEEREFDPAATQSEGAVQNGRSRKPGDISPLAFGWIAAITIILCYMIGSSFLIALFADGVSEAEGANITTPNLFTASIIGQVLFLLLPALFFAGKSPLRMREALRLRNAHVSFFLLASFGVISCLILGATWLIFQELYLIPDSLMPLYREAQKGSEWLSRHIRFGPDIPLLLFALLAVAIVPAVSEELVFRGIIQRHFEERLKPIGAIILAGVIFGAIHWQPANFLPLTGVGAFLGLVAWASRSIWPAIFAHFFFNAVQIVLPNLTQISFDQMERNPSREDLYALLPIALISLIALISITRTLWRMRIEYR